MLQTYANPILSGFYPDPSICRVMDDYYLVSSSFAYFPGLPVFHSKDLVHWKLLGHAVNRPEQMDFTGLAVSRGLFAPSIRYHQGLFYISCTLVDGGGNFVLTTADPGATWSLPAWLPQIDGIDPSLFFDDDGKSYLVYNSTAPGNRPLYNGHRTIRLHPFDLEGMQLTGKERILVNGGTDLSKQPRWIEGPHLFKKYGHYYLIAAEGGTGYEHSVVVFRSKNLESSFLPYEHNPILTQRNLDQSGPHPFTSTGHADLVELPDSSWQAVFLACRPYENDHYNTGRETCLAPVTWRNEWPHINDGQDKVQNHYPLPLGENRGSSNKKYSGQFTYRDEFTLGSLDKDWMFLRTPHESWYQLIPGKGLLMQLRSETCAGRQNPSFLARRQQHLYCTATTALVFQAATADEKAGLLVFQDEDHFYYLCCSVCEGQQQVQLYRSVLMPADGCRMELLAAQACTREDGNQVYLGIEARAGSYHFYYSLQQDHWNEIGEGLDARFLSSYTAGSFVGCVFALYATSLGKESFTNAEFAWFEYKGM